MPTPFPLELVTPERVLFSGQVDEATMRTDEGEISFLAAHEDYVAAVDITVVRLSVIGGAAPVAGAGARAPEEGAGEELRVAVHGGFVQVDRAGVVILASVAEIGPEVDVERARRALEAAQAEIGAGEGVAGPAGGGGAPAERPTGTESALAELPGAAPLVSPSPAMLAVLEPESPLVRARRARARLEAAGATP